MGVVKQAGAACVKREQEGEGGGGKALSFTGRKLHFISPVMLLVTDRNPPPPTLGPIRTHPVPLRLPLIYFPQKKYCIQ